MTKNKRVKPYEAAPLADEYPDDVARYRDLLRDEFCYFVQQHQDLNNHSVHEVANMLNMSRTALYSYMSGARAVPVEIVAYMCASGWPTAREHYLALLTAELDAATISARAKLFPAPAPSPAKE